MHSCTYFWNEQYVLCHNVYVIFSSINTHEFSRIYTFGYYYSFIVKCRINSLSVTSTIDTYLLYYIRNNPL